MKAKIVSTVLIVLIFLGWFFVSCWFVPTSFGVISLIAQATIGVVLSVMIIVGWLWRE